MKTPISSALACVPLMFALALHVPAGAQSSLAQITGTVTDPTGSAIPGAEVRVQNLATNIVYRGESNVQGIFRFQALSPGSFRLEAESTGFKKFTQGPLTVQVGDILPVEISLEVGDVTEVVEVSGTAIALESETASLGDVITGRAIDQLPIGIKDSFQLVFLAPGVVRGRVAPSSSQPDERLQSRTSFKISGGRDFAQEILLDGMPNSGVDFGSAAYVPNPGMTAEFKVHTNSFSAEYGRTTGGVVEMVTKSGGADFHGGAYWYHRNTPFDANNFFNNRSGTPRPELRRHQYGANIGGPIPYRSTSQKSFFFFSYEGLRLATPQSGQLTVPTAAQREGDFSQTFYSSGGSPALISIYDPLTLTAGADGALLRTPFAGNRIPASRFDAVARNVVGLYPMPNIPGDAITSIRNYGFSGSRSVSTDNTSVRGDHNFGPDNRLFVRHSRVHYVRDSFRAFEAHNVGNNDDIGHQGVIRDTHVFSPTVTVDASYSYTRHYTSEFCPSLGYDLTTIGLPQSLASFGRPCIPFFSASGMSTVGRGRFLSQPRVTKSYTANVSKQFSRHFLKAGFQSRNYTFSLIRNLNPSGTFSFNDNFTRGPDPFLGTRDAGFGFASLLLGMGSGGGVFKENPLSLQRLYTSAYVQDDWKVTSRLTLNLGLRYVVDRGTREWHDRLSGLDLDVRSPLSDQLDFDVYGIQSYRGEGNPRDLSAVDLNNFGPRIGLAYKLTDDTALRIGYGLFYSPQIAINNVGTQGFETTTPWIATQDGGLTAEATLSDPFPNGFNLPTVDRDPLGQVGFGLNSSTDDDRIGYSQQWNLSIQHQFGRDLLVDAAYVGSKGTKLPWGDGLQANFVPNAALDLGPAELNRQVANPFQGVITNPSSRLSRGTVPYRQLLLPFPQYTSIVRSYVAAASSIYHSAQMKVTKRAASGLHLMASYTISKQIDDSSVMRGWLDTNGGGPANWENLRLERAVSTMDTPQRLVVSYIYDLPVGRSQAVGRNWSKPVDAILGGWQLAGITTFQSGRPVNINRRSLSTGQSAKLSNPTIDRWFDTSAFELVPTVGLASLGNVGRTLPDVRSHGTANFDITLAKRWAMLEDRLNWQIRAEFLNAFNTPQFNFPGNNPRAARTFGVVRSTANTPRSVQFGIVLDF